MELDKKLNLETETNRKKLLSLKLVLFSCLQVIVLKKRLDCSHSVEERLEVFKDYAALMKKTDLAKYLSKTKMMLTKRDEAQKQVKSLKDQMEVFIHEELMSHQNRQVRENYQENGILRIEIKDPEASFRRMWEAGRMLLEEEASLVEEICLEVVGRVDEKRRNWAAVELYK